MELHSCFGEDGQLQVFDIWESQEPLDERLTYLGPVMEELRIELAGPAGTPASRWAALSEMPDQFPIPSPAVTPNARLGARRWSFLLPAPGLPGGEEHR
jgi:hypothetical protein